MGLLIHTSFDTAQGFSVASVYCRIARFTHDPRGSGMYTITLKPETHLSRDARLAGKMPLPTPGLPELLSMDGVLGDMVYLYSLLKSDLESRGWTVEDVLESPPEPPAPTETSPAEPVPEPPAPTETSPTEPPAPEPAPEPVPEPTPTEPVPEPAPEPPAPTETSPEPVPEPVPEPTPTEPTPTESTPEPVPEPTPEPEVSQQSSESTQ